MLAAADSVVLSISTFLPHCLELKPIRCLNSCVVRRCPSHIDVTVPVRLNASSGI